MHSVYFVRLANANMAHKGEQCLCAANVRLIMNKNFILPASNSINFYHYIVCRYVFNRIVIVLNLCMQPFHHCRSLDVRNIWAV